MSKQSLSHNGPSRQEVFQPGVHYTAPKSIELLINLSNSDPAYKTWIDPPPPIPGISTQAVRRRHPPPFPPELHAFVPKSGSCARCKAKGYVCIIYEGHIACTACASDRKHCSNFIGGENNCEECYALHKTCVFSRDTSRCDQCVRFDTHCRRLASERHAKRYTRERGAVYKFEGYVYPEEHPAQTEIANFRRTGSPTMNSADIQKIYNPLSANNPSAADTEDNEMTDQPPSPAPKRSKTPSGRPAAKPAPANKQNARPGPSSALPAPGMGRPSSSAQAPTTPAAAATQAFASSSSGQGPGAQPVASSRTISGVKINGPLMGVSSSGQHRNPTAADLQRIKDSMSDADFKRLEAYAKDRKARLEGPAHKQDFTAWYKFSAEERSTWDSTDASPRCPHLGPVMCCGRGLEMADEDAVKAEEPDPSNRFALTGVVQLGGSKYPVAELKMVPNDPRYLDFEEYLVVQETSAPNASLRTYGMMCPQNLAYGVRDNKHIEYAKITSTAGDHFVPSIMAREECNSKTEAERYYRHYPKIDYTCTRHPGRNFTACMVRYAKAGQPYVSPYEE